MRLNGNVAVVTGAAKGIGRGISQVFASEGCRVVIADVDEVLGAALEREIEASGGTARFVRTDVRESTAIKAAVDAALDAWGRLDIMVNNAGWHPPATSLDETTLELFESQLRLNLTSSFLGCKYAAPHLRKTRGSIIMMASMVGLLGQRDAAAYCASKAGQIGLTKALAVDLAPH
ncbi:MAG: SDR family oxidoreductase, partial [Actinobacteria bacterium]|nr:SDR family oxidoreductase [Actinomycetota bacterium]